MTGNNFWLIVGPSVIAAALVIWLALVLYGRSSKNRRENARQHATQRGPVSGGVIEGSPVQRNRRDPAPRSDR